MSRTIANGREFGLVRVVWRRFATARYLSGIFESYRWSFPKPAPFGGLFRASRVLGQQVAPLNVAPSLAR